MNTTIQKGNWIVLQKTHNYALIICLPMGLPLEHPQGAHRNPSGDGRDWVLLFSQQGRGVV